MRDLGGFPCAAASVLDVSPDLWACALEDNMQALHGPQQEHIVLTPSADDLDLDGLIMHVASPACVARFSRLKSSAGTYDVALGFENGFVRFFGQSGVELFALHCHPAPILRLEWNHRHSTAKKLCVLYDDKTLAIIEWESDPTPKRSWRKYALHGQTAILAVLPCAETRPSLFQVHARVGLQNALAVGCDPIIGFFHAGNDASSILHIAHIASAVASRATGAVWSLAKNWGWSAEKAPSSANDVAPTPLDVASELGLPNTLRQKARAAVLSPHGRLALVPDSLGRILLLDTSTMLLVRLWKGYRDAQVGWMTMDAKSDVPGLHMVFYSARRGFVEVWRARHDPRVLCVSVGAHAKLQLCTLVNSPTQTSALSPLSASNPPVLSCLAFLDGFAPPLRHISASPETTRSLYLLLQRKSRGESTFCDCLDQMHILVARPLLLTANVTANRDAWLTLCFGPLETTVFAVTVRSTRSNPVDRVSQ